MGSLAISIMSEYRSGHLPQRFWKVEPAFLLAVWLNPKTVAGRAPGMFLTDVDQVFEVKFKIQDVIG